MPNAIATPIDGFEANEALCEKCNSRIDDEAYYLMDAYYCESCICTLERDAEIAATAFAEKNCRVTDQLPKYDASQEFKCSPQEYENGDRESYSLNSYLSACRHSCTNYDELIRNLDRSNSYDRFLYLAIHKRVMQLIKEELGDDPDHLMKDYSQKHVLEDQIFNSSGIPLCDAFRMQSNSPRKFR